MIQSQIAILIVLLGLTTNLLASENSKTTVDEKALNECVAEEAIKASQDTTIKTLKALCHLLLQTKESDGERLSPIEERIKNELAVRDNPSVITPHKRNYMLPISYVDNPNSEPFRQNGNDFELDNVEAKFQLSFKAPLAEELFLEKDILFFGFTVQSYWQMYNSDVSSPFRETNYQPEVFYGFVNDYKVGEWTNMVNIIGIEHQSNGRSQPLSRSWNRIYAQIVWENHDWVFMFKPWYRLPEKEKADPNQPDGDDNPDIGDYMGFFEFTSLYRWDDQTFGMMLRNNLKNENNRGAIQLDWTFPMGKRFKGYAQLFSGYGESLIDYNHKTTRLGVGVLLTDIF